MEMFLKKITYLFEMLIFKKIASEGKIQKLVKMQELLVQLVHTPLQSK
jgi:hypothetical protein